jgi:hypothetical protein
MCERQYRSGAHSLSNYVATANVGAAGAGFDQIGFFSLYFFRRANQFPPRALLSMAYI